MAELNTDIKRALDIIADVLTRNVAFHKARDRMNAELHMAKEPRWSPVTSETDAALSRLLTLIEG